MFQSPDLLLPTEQIADDREMLTSVVALAPGGYNFGARYAHWRPANLRVFNTRTSRTPYVIRSAQRVEPVINAFTYDRYEAAMSDALAAEEAYGRRVPMLLPTGRRDWE